MFCVLSPRHDVTFECTSRLRGAVYLVEALDADHDAMMHLKAIVFCRPTRANIELLKKMLDTPKFAQYSLCTSLLCLCATVALSVCAQADLVSVQSNGVLPRVLPDFFFEPSRLLEHP